MKQMLRGLVVLNQKPRWLLLTILVIAGVIVMLRLGIWQLDRLAERRASNAQIEARLDLPAVDLNAPDVDVTDLAYRHVRLTGTFDAAHEIVLRNQARLDQPGQHIITPLRLAGSEQAVLVDRGWIPYDQSPARYPPTATAVIEGVARASQQRSSWLSPADATPAPGAPPLAQWYRVDIPAIQNQVPYPLLPVYVQAAPAAEAAGLPARAIELDLSEGPHLGYAIQWFAFALILLGGYVVLVRQRMH